MLLNKLVNIQNVKRASTESTPSAASVAAIVYSASEVKRSLNPCMRHRVDMTLRFRRSESN